MGYFSNLAIDTRTCGQADEDARLDRSDKLTTRAERAAANRARISATLARMKQADRARPLPMNGTDYHKFGEE